MQDFDVELGNGYALVALLAFMAVLMLTMMAAAPVIRQQMRRELEKEASARDEEAAEAIRLSRRTRSVIRCGPCRFLTSCSYVLRQL